MWLLIFLLLTLLSYTLLTLLVTCLLTFNFCKTNTTFFPEVYRGLRWAISTPSIYTSDVSTVAGQLGWQFGDRPQCLIYDCNGLNFHLEYSGDKYSLSIPGRAKTELEKWGFPDQLTSYVLYILTKCLPVLKRCSGVRKRAPISLTNLINVERLDEGQFIRDVRCTGIRGFLSSSESCRLCTVTYQNLVSRSAKRTVCIVHQHNPYFCQFQQHIFDIHSTCYII